MAILFKKVLPGIIFLGIGVALILGLLFRLDLAQLWSAISRLNIGNFSVILALTLIGIFIGVWRGKIILRSQGVSLSILDIFFIGVSGVAFNYLTPIAGLGGEGIKIYLLTQRFKVDTRTASVFVALDKLLEVTAAFLVIFFGVLALLAYLGPEGLTTAMLIIALSVGGLSVIFASFYYVLFRKKKVFSAVLKFLRLGKTKFANAIRNAEDDILEFFDPRSPGIWKAWILSLLRQVVQIARQAFIIYTLGRGLQIGASVMSLSALYFGYTIPIPAAIGAQEAFQTLLFAIFRWTAEEGLAVSLILRAADVFIVGLGVLVLFKYGIKVMTRTLDYLRGQTNLNSSQTEGDSSGRK